MFDDQQAVAIIHQAVQHLHELFHIGQMQTHGEFVWHVQRARHFIATLAEPSRASQSSITCLIRFISPGDGLGLGVEACALASFAQHFHIGPEAHADV